MSITSLPQRIIRFYSDREYFNQMVRIALPIASQNLVSSSLSMVSMLMVGQLGETTIAAVGLSNQVFFLLNIILFGIMSGSAMFTAQLWGKRDIVNIRRVLGLAVKLGLGVALLFWSLALFLPARVLGFYTEDPAVIALGTQYLRIFCWTYGFFSISFAYSMVLRSTGNVRLPLMVSVAALSLNALLAYLLIFGKLGLPTLGITGAAIAGLISRILECAAILILTYRDRHNPAAASLRDLVGFDFKFIGTVLKPVLPVIANEVLWSTGITTYNAIYAHVGTDAIAAMNIVGTIDALAFVLFIGIGNATSILVGNLIGRGEKDQAFRYAGRSLGLQLAGGALMGGIVALSANGFVSLYNVSPQVAEATRRVLYILSAAAWMRALNMTIIVGILRSGGDTIYSLVLDGFVIWIVGVPLSALAAFVFHFPIHIVYLFTLTEEAVKMIAGLWRYFTRRWINDLTHLDRISTVE